MIPTLPRIVIVKDGHHREGTEAQACFKCALDLGDLINFGECEVHASPLTSKDEMTRALILIFGENILDAAEVGFAVAGAEGEVVDVGYARAWVGVGAVR